MFEQLTAEEIADFKNVLAEFSGIAVNDAAVAALTDPALFGEIRQFGIGDTETNSAIGSAFSRALVGRDWPTNGERREGLDFDQFLASVTRAARARGWVLDPAPATP